MAAFCSSVCSRQSWGAVRSTASAASTGGELHRRFADRAREQRRAIILRRRPDPLELLLAILLVDRVDNALSLAIRQRRLRRLPIRGVDHPRRLDPADQLLVERPNVLDLCTVRGL